MDCLGPHLQQQKAAPSAAHVATEPTSAPREAAKITHHPATRHPSSVEQGGTVERLELGTQQTLGKLCLDRRRSGRARGKREPR